MVSFWCRAKVFNRADISGVGVRFGLVASAGSVPNQDCLLVQVNHELHGDSQENLFPSIPHIFPCPAPAMTAGYMHALANHV